MNTVRAAVPRLLLNRGAVGPFERKPLRRGDYMELGDLSESVRRLAQVLGWHQEIEELMWGQENQVCLQSLLNMFIRVLTEEPKVTMLLSPLRTRMGNSVDHCRSVKTFSNLIYSYYKKNDSLALP